MRACLSILIAVWALASAAGAEVSVNAQLSHRTAEVGTQVQLQVEVNGVNGDVNPPEVKVDGLDVRFEFPSSSQQIQIVNGRMTSERKTTLVYAVTPAREGDFTIPPLEVEVEGRKYRTQPVALKVQKSSGAPGADTAPSATAEIEVKRKSVYVGEVVPVEVRLVVDLQLRPQMETAPNLSGDGFTVQKFPNAVEDREVRDGREYGVVRFRSAMTPTKAGKLTIGPCEMTFIGQVPRPKRRGGGRSLFDQFFSDDFFNPLNVERKRFVAKAEAIELEVKPLPTEGRPREFAGAVGKFEFEASGSPATVKLGEPVTMRLVVSGDGNFDRVQAPVLVSEDGWKAYEAAEKFDADNEMKSSGRKTFEIPVVPETKHRQMPQFAFSYFDPEAAKYVTLRSKPQPLDVQGEPLVAPAPAAPVATPAAATPAPRSDIAGIRYEEGSRATFAPLHTRAGFWVAHGIAALAAAGLLASRWLRSDSAKARVAALRRERDELWRAVRSGEDFYERATQLVRVETALRGGVEPVTVDASVAKRIVNADAEASAAIDAIFEASAERLYAGGAVETTVAAAECERMMKTLERLYRR